MAPWAALPCVAQAGATTASVNGSVADSTGALIAGAHVVLREQATGRERMAAADTRGRFRFGLLSPGAYLLRIDAPGFAAQQRALAVPAGGEFDLDVTLAPAGTQQTASVTAQPPVVETGRTEIAGVVETREAAALPWLGRNSLDLALLLPGVAAANTGNTQVFAETSPVVGQGYSVNGQRNLSNSLLVDGLSSDDPASGLAVNSFGLETVRSFQVITSGADAEFGRALGGFASIVTASGTNHLHGGAYGFLRSRNLNARNALSGTRLPLTEAIYGATIGGPLGIPFANASGSGRAFFFLNFEQQRRNTAGILTIQPADALAINARLRAVGYRAALLPVSAGGTTQYPTTVHTSHIFARQDLLLGTRNSVAVRYSRYALGSLNARGAGGLLDTSYGTALQDTTHSLAVSDIYTGPAGVLNELRAGWTRDRLQAPPNDSVGPNVIIAGVATFGRFSTSPVARDNDIVEAADNLGVSRGAHALKSGASLLVSRDTLDQPQYLRGGYVFSSLAAFLAGRYNTQGFLQTIGIAGSSALQQTSTELGVYAQDEWHARAGVTVHAGLRYDLQFLQTIHTDTNNVAPRLGVAWSPRTDGRLVVRANFGLFFDRVPLRGLANALLSAGNTTDPTKLRLLSYTFSPGQAGAPVFPQIAAGPPAGVPISYTVMDRHLQNGVAQQASLQVEQQTGARSSVAVSYQHLRGMHLGITGNTNIRTDGSRPNPALGNVRAYQSAADSQYDALAVTAVERHASWAEARVSYTWAKAISDIGEFFFSTPSNYLDPGVDRSRSDEDARHRLALNLRLASPERRGGDGAWRGAVLGGWQAALLLQANSAPPFNIVTGASTLQGTPQRPCAPGLTLMGVNACTEALHGGTIGRNAGRGFGFAGVNARVGRNFAFGEAATLEAAAEAYNALNHRNNLVPNGTFGTNPYPAGAPAAGFGQPTAVGDARSVELHLRLGF